MANVLVIDDDPDTRELVKAALEAAGHKIRRAAGDRPNRRQHCLRRHRVCLLRIRMPDAGAVFDAGSVAFG